MNEMFAADVRNWFADLAIGAKAQTQEIKFGNHNWERASVFDNGVRDGIPTVNVHYLKKIARLAGFEVQHRDFVLGDYYYDVFRGEDFVIFNGVKFTGFDNTLTEQERNLRKVEEAEARKKKEEEEDD